MNWSIKGYGVLLNPGHAGTVGAVGINPKITEEKYADIQVAHVRKILNQNIFPNAIVMQNGNNLYEIGKQANRYDMALAFHFNAFDKRERGAVVVVSNKATVSSCVFAEKLCGKLNFAVFNINKNPIHMRSDLAFLNGALKTKCPIACIIESEFIDDETNESDFEKRVLIEAEVIANFIMDHFRKEK